MIDGQVVGILLGTFLVIGGLVFLVSRRVAPEPRLGAADQVCGETSDSVDEGSGQGMDAVSSFPATRSNAQSSLPMTESLICLHIMAGEDRQYVGYELLQALLSAGLCFGERHIFHRYAEQNGKGQPLFSLASAVEPGTFELSKMGSFSCPGVSLFMMIDAHPAPDEVLQLLLETVQRLVDDLGGDVFDAQFEPFDEEAQQQLIARVDRVAASLQQYDLFAEPNFPAGAAGV